MIGIIMLLLLTGTILIVWLVAVPDPNAIPLHRRRTVKEATFLESATEMSTTLIQRMLTGREGKLAQTLNQASIPLRPADFLLMVASASVVAAAIGMLFGGAGAGVLLALLMLGLAWVAVKFLTGRRRQRFAKQVPEILQLISGSLRAGFSLNQAITSVARESDSPAKDEFVRAINEYRIGYPLPTALGDISSRMDNDDWYWVTQAIAINREVGGNLADVIDGVGDTIRQRVELKDHVKTLSSEGKLSAIILCSLPFGVAAIVSLSQPGYMVPLYTTLLGWIIIGVSAVMLGLGIVWMRAIINIKF